MRKISAGQPLDKIEITVKKIKLRKSMNVRPTDLFEDSRFWLPGKFANHKEKQVHAAASRVLVFITR
jgi:hypothetical protein